MKDLLWSSWKNGQVLKYEISKKIFYKHINQVGTSSNKRYFVELIKHSDRKIELYFPLGVLRSFKYFDFVEELDLRKIDLLIQSVIIKVSDTNEIERVKNLPELRERFATLMKLISEQIEEQQVDIVKIKFSYLLQRKDRIQNVLWPDIDFILEDYLVGFEADSYIDFDNDSENEKVTSSLIDMCQNYRNENDDCVVEYFEAKNNLLGKRNNFEKMKSLFLKDDLNFNKLKYINFMHRKYLYDNTSNALKSAILYKKVDSKSTKILDVAKIRTVSNLKK